MGRSILLVLYCGMCWEQWILSLCQYRKLEPLKECYICSIRHGHSWEWSKLRIELIFRIDDTIVLYGVVSWSTFIKKSSFTPPSTNLCGTRLQFILKEAYSIRFRLYDDAFAKRTTNRCEARHPMALRSRTWQSLWQREESKRCCHTLLRWECMLALFCSR